MYKKVKNLLSILFVLCCFLPLSWAKAPWQVDRVTIDSSHRDNRQYQVIKLDNGMQVLLVSDPQATKSLVAVAIPVGSLDDPQSQQGLAHYLEHMIFMGSKRYPEPDSITEFLSKHGGSYNASTAPQRTSFYLEVDNKAFATAVDQLSDALAQPLLDPMYSDRERNAVNAELTMARSRDGLRMGQVDSETVNPKHPAAKFFGGNLETLSDKPGSKLHDELVKFYHHYYSSNIMTAVLYSNRSLNELAELASTTFGRITNNNVIIQASQEPLLTDKEKGVIIHYVPVQPLKLLRIDFNVRNNTAEFRSKADTYLAYLISNRSENTLASWLQEQGLADSIETSVASSLHRNSGTFSIFVTLTDKGLEQRDLIINAIFAYLRLIEKQGVTQEYFSEMTKILKLDFEYQSISRDMGYVSSLASALLVVPPKYVLTADYIADNYQPSLIIDRLKELTPQDARIWFISPNEPSDKKAYFVDAPYQLTTIPANLLTQWETGKNAPALSLPALNPYLPDNFSLIKSYDPSKKPQMIMNDGVVRAFYMPSHYFAEEPKADITLALRTPLASDNARHQVLFALNDYLASLAIAQLNYQASLGGINISIGGGNGVSFSAEGFSQRLTELLTKLLIEYRDFVPTQAQLDQAKINYLDQLNGADKVQAFQLAMQPVNALSSVPYTERAIRRQQLKDITLEEVIDYRKQLLSSSKPELLVIGNLTAKQVVTLAKSVVSIVSPKGAVWWHGEEVIINKRVGASMTAKAASSDSALVAVYIPTGYKRLASVARSRLLEQILHPWFFAQLRTEEQLGYALFVSTISVGKQAGVGFILQSSDKTPDYLYQRYQAFYQQAEKRLSLLNDAEFAQYKQGLISELQRKPQTLSEEAGRFIGDFGRSNYQFDSRELLIHEIDKLQLSDLLLFFRQAVVEQQGLAILSQVIGNKDNLSERNFIPLPEGWTHYENATLLQQQFPLYVRP